MAWRALTSSDIETGFAAAELTALRSVQLGVDIVDVEAQTIQMVVDEVRGYIAGSVVTVLGAEGTIPDKLVATAIDMAVWYMAKRLPVKSLATDARKEAYDQAMRKLRDVAANRFRIEAPTTVSTETIAIPTPAISNRVRDQRRRYEDGI
jgi:hypothetical protein